MGNDREETFKVTTVTWRERTVCRILLIIAKMIAPNGSVADDVKYLANHISTAREPEK